MASPWFMLIYLAVINGYFGIISGIITAICGVIKGKLKLAIGGFFACLFSALPLGLIACVPVCAIFMYKIFKSKDQSDK